MSESRRPRKLGWRARVLGIVLAVLLGTAALEAPSASAGTDPAFDVPRAELDAAVQCPAFTHPDRDPVLLVHGTGLTYAESWAWGYAEALRSMGYDVCGIDLPQHALVDIQVSSEYVANAVLRIAAASGRRVDLIGHSQGNLEIRWAMRWWSRARSLVDDAILLASPSHGGVLANGLCVLQSCSPVSWQMGGGSRFLDALNAGDETPGEVSYTSVYSQTDELVQPWTSSPIAGASNVAVQQVCPARIVSHGAMLYDAVVFALALDALSHGGAADPSRVAPSTCLRLLAPKVSLLDISAFNAILGPVVASRLLLAPHVASEPPLMSYAVD